MVNESSDNTPAQGTASPRAHLQDLDPGAIREKHVSIEGFQPFNHPQLLQKLESARIFKKKDLINKINYTHFIEGKIFLHLQHPKYSEYFLLPVYPEPCQGNTFICRRPDLKVSMLEAYTFLHLIIPGAQFIIVSPAEMQSISENHFIFHLPDKSYAVNKREVVRYPSPGLETELFQNAFFAKGALIDFSPFGFRIKLKSDSVSSLNWFNPDAPMTICIRKGERPLFSSLCHCIRSPNENSGKVIVLAPSIENVHQFQKTKSRNPRRQLVPSFEVAFNHPFFGKKINRTVYDISTSGFSVLEESDKGTLIPGMIIPDLTIIYAGAIELTCNLTQVLYRQAQGDGKVRCGIAILDMNIKHYTHLANIISQAIDPHACISYKVDLDELWSFFFEPDISFTKKTAEYTAMLR